MAKLKFHCIYKQERYVNFLGFSRIPGIYSGFTIDIHGEIKYRTGDIKIPIRIDEHGEWLSLICIDGIVREFNLAVLVSMVARNVSWSVDVCSKLTMYFLDGDCTNVHPSNTLMAPLPDEIEYLEGWRYIPGFSRYVINEYGTLWRVDIDRKKSWSPDKDGYFISSLLNDLYVKKLNRRTRTVKRHRIVLFAFTQYPVNAINLQVNHKNSIPGSDHKSNLEWCTPKQNHRHAAKYGNIKYREVKTLSVENGNELSFINIHTAAKYYSLSPQGIAERCLSDGQLIYKPATLFKYADSPTPWPDLEYAKKHLLSDKSFYYYIEINGITKQFFKLKQLANFTKIHYDIIRKKLTHNDTVFYKEFKIWKDIFSLS